MKKELSNEQKGRVLDKIYGYVVDGLPYVDQPIEDLVIEYKSKYVDKDENIHEDSATVGSTRNNGSCHIF